MGASAAVEQARSIVIFAAFHVISPGKPGNEAHRSVAATIAVLADFAVFRRLRCHSCRMSRFAGTMASTMPAYGWRRVGVTAASGRYCHFCRLSRFMAMAGMGARS